MEKCASCWFFLRMYITRHGSEKVVSVPSKDKEKAHCEPYNPSNSRSFRYRKISIIHGRVYERWSPDKCDAVYSENI
jgi:hypothetical protein